MQSKACSAEPDRHATVRLFLLWLSWLEKFAMGKEKDTGALSRPRSRPISFPNLTHLLTDKLLFSSTSFPS